MTCFHFVCYTHVYSHCLYVMLTYSPLKENEGKHIQSYGCCFLYFVLGDEDADHKKYVHVVLNKNICSVRYSLNEFNYMSVIQPHCGDALSCHQL